MPLHVHAEHAGDTVGVHAPEVGLDHRIGEQRRVVPAHPDLLEDLLCPAPQSIRGEHDTAVNTCHTQFSFRSNSRCQKLLVGRAAEYMKRVPGCQAN